MLINKIESVEDMEALTSLPDERIEEILKDTPEYLLDIMGKLLRALLYSMNLEEEETENAVSKIKERKMGRLFENVTFDFQEEKRKAREEARREGLKEGREEAMRELAITRRIAKLSKQSTITEIQEDLIKEFHLSQAQAEEACRMVFEE